MITVYQWNGASCERGGPELLPESAAAVPPDRVVWVALTEPTPGEGGAGVTGMRKTLVIEREVLARLIRGEFKLVEGREIVYYRNVYDHFVRYTELIEGGCPRNGQRPGRDAPRRRLQPDHEGAGDDLHDHPAHDVHLQHLRHKLRTRAGG